MARCPTCSGIVATGCLCNVVDSDCFDSTGAGTAASPFTFSPILDPDVDNLLECRATGPENEQGLFADLPTTISNPPTGLAFHSANQTIANNTLTAITLNSEDYDSDNMHSVVSNMTRLVFVTAGLYLIEFHCAWNKHQTGNRYAAIRKNGSNSQILAQDSKLTADHASWVMGHNLVVQDEFIANDYVEGVVQQTSGTSLILLGRSYSPALSATKI